METDLSWRLSDNGVAEHFTAFENILNIASVFFELIENEVLQVSSYVGAEDEAKCPTCNYQHRTGAAITAIYTVGDY